MTSFAYQNNNDLADPGFIEILKNCNDVDKFLTCFCKCFSDLNISEFSAVVHYNVKEMLKFFVDDRKKLKAEKKELEMSAAEIMEKCDQITAYFAVQEKKIKNLVGENQKLFQQISNLQADLGHQQAHYEKFQSSEKKKVQNDIGRLEKKVNDLTEENRSLAAEIQKSVDRAKEADEIIKAAENRLIENTKDFSKELEELRQELNGKLDDKTSECDSIEKELKDKIKKLQSKQDELVKEHEAATSLLYSQIEQLQQEVNSLALQNQQLSTKFNDMKKRKMLLNEVAAESGKEIALLNKQMKKTKDKKMVEEKKEEEVISDGMKHVDCEKQIQHLNEKLKVKEELLEEAEKKQKEYEERRQVHIKRTHLITECEKEVLGTVEQTLASPSIKRHKIEKHSPQQQSTSAPSTSFSASVPPPQKLQPPTLPTTSFSIPLQQQPSRQQPIPPTCFSASNQMMHPLQQQHQNGYGNFQHFLAPYYQQIYHNGPRMPITVPPFSLHQQNSQIYAQQAFMQQQFHNLPVEQQKQLFFQSSAPPQQRQQQ
uniref:Uncharacterized protein n=1 Tax=Panagrolaimus sp. PS1159 TaxID=55785 RepID=A0AC35F1J4_9BILA